jgi:hypothetical protein
MYISDIILGASDGGEIVQQVLAAMDESQEATNLSLRPDLITPFWFATVEWLLPIRVIQGSAMYRINTVPVVN